MDKSLSQSVVAPTGIASDERLKRLAELSLTLTGDPASVFRRISRMIGELLGVRVVCLSEIRGNELYFISVYVDGDVLLDAGHCPLSVTPCATVRNSKDLRIYERVMELFPDATFLKEHNAFSYCGFPALDSNGDVIAVTCLLDDKPHEFSQDDQALLRIFGQRIAFELERKRQLESQQKTEQALQTGEKHYRHLVETAHAVPWTFDMKTACFTYVGPQAEELLGYPVEDWYKEGFWQNHILEEDRDWAVDYCLTSAGRREDHDFEYRMLTADGSVVWIRDSVNVLADENGPYEMQGFMFDVTEHKGIENALNKLNEMGARDDIDEFYRACVASLAKVYGAKYALLGLVTEDTGSVQTQAVWADGSYADNFRYELAGTPCADILNCSKSLIPHDVARLYPDDQLLVEMGVDSYFGAPLITSDGRTVGLIAILDDKPMSLSRWVEPILGIFAQRIAIEFERHQTEQALRHRDVRMMLQQEVLLTLAQQQPVIYDDREKYLQLATEAACKTLQVGRSSIWLYEKDPDRIICLDLYEAADTRHSSGLEVYEKDVPAYFKALHENRAIVAHDAHHARETYEFSENYLAPLGISSMLDAPIRIGGEMVGVLCCEHIGEQRRWELDEQNFASALADTVSLSLELAEHKETEIELRAHREHLEELVEQRTGIVRQQSQIINQIHDSVVTTDMQGIVTSWNRGAEKLFGYTAEEALGQHVSFLYPERRHDHLANEVIEPLQASGFHEVEVIMQRKSGGEFYAHLSLSLLYDDDNAPVGMVGYSLDITDRKHYESLLIKAKTEADKANFAKSEFLSRMSHELRTPLNSILGFTSILKTGKAGPINEEQMQQLGRVYENGEHLHEMINDILDLAKIESGKTEVVLGSFDVADVLDELLTCFMPQAQKKGLVLEHHSMPGEVMVTTDRDKLWHVLQNLLSNAVKYTKQGKITVTLKVNDDTIMITISDTGIGIKQERIDHIFNAFEQADNASSREYSGVGLGLAICREYMAMLKGDISVVSEIGKGSRFTISFPRDCSAD